MTTKDSHKIHEDRLEVDLMLYVVRISFQSTLAIFARECNVSQPKVKAAEKTDISLNVVCKTFVLCHQHVST